MSCELMGKLRLQYKRVSQHYAKKKKKREGGLLLPARGAAILFLCACTWLCGIQLSVVSIYACMCRCSPYSKDRCVSRPSGRQSGRESGSIPGHTCE